MTQFPRSIARLPAGARCAGSRCLPRSPLWRAPSADAAARRRAAGAYDGTWNVVFATTRGNCSSGYSVPFTVTGSRVSSAGGGRVSGSVNRAGARCGQCFGRRIQGEWRRPARRHQRRGFLARHHHRRPLQRHLAGDAELARMRATQPRGAIGDRMPTKTARQIDPDGPLSIRQSAELRISAAPAPSRPGGLRNARPARPWRTRRRRP